jgi:hypothetical protein
VKGKSSYRLLREFPELKKRYWGSHLWADQFNSCPHNEADGVPFSLGEGFAGKPWLSIKRLISADAKSVTFTFKDYRIGPASQQRGGQQALEPEHNE